MYDVVIIGAGISGCSVAYALARYNLRVAIVERAADVSDGTSKANTAIVHAGHDTTPGTLKSKYNLLGNAMYDDLCTELDVPFRRNGTIVVAFGDDRDDEIETLAAQGTILGCPGITVLGKTEIKRMIPNISGEVTAALLAPSGGIVSPYELVIAMAENAVLNGVELMLNTTVKTMAKNGENWVLGTDKGEIETRVVVNCAGVYADEFNNMVSEHKYYIKPRLGEYVIMDKIHGGDFLYSICTLPIKMASGHTKGLWIAPTVSGTIMLGPTATDVEDKEFISNTAEGFKEITEKSKIMWPDVPLGDLICCYAGLRAHCDKDDFQLGEAPDAPGFFNCGGIESPGLTAAPAFGKDIAAEIAAKLGAAEKDNHIKGRDKSAKPFRYMNDKEREQAIAGIAEYGRIVCRCETVTEAEIRAAIRRAAGAKTLDAVKRRTRAGMGRCQGGFCSTRVIQILCEELGVSPLEITKSGGESNLLLGAVFEDGGNDERD